MIRAVLAGVIGLAAGVLMMLVVSASVDSRTAREEKLEEQVAELQGRVCAVETARDKAIAAVETKLSEAKKAAEAQAKQHAAVMAQAKSDHKLQAAKLADLQQKVRQDFGFTLDQVLGAVKCEYAVTGSDKLYQVAGGKVTLTAIEDDDKTLIAVHVLSGREHLVEFGRTMMHVLSLVRPYKNEDRAERATWLTASAMFTEQLSEVWVRRTFDGMSVGVSAMPLSGAKPMIVGNFHVEP